MAVFKDIIYQEMLLPIVNTFIDIPAYVAAPVVNILLLGVTLSIMFQGLDTIRGAGGASPILDVIAKSTRPILVLMFAASLAAFNDNVRPFLEKDLLLFLINAGADAAGKASIRGDNVYGLIFQSLDTAANEQFAALKTMSTEASRHLKPVTLTWGPLYIGWPISDNLYIIPQLGSDMSGFIAYPMIGLLYILIVVTAIIVALQAIFVTVALNFVLAFGPLFLAMYAFEKTEKYATNWLDSVLKYVFSLAVLMILYLIGSAVLTRAMIRTAELYIASPTSIDNLLTNSWPPFVIGIAFAYILSRADELSRDLIGGQSSSSGSFMAAAGGALAGAAASTLAAPNNLDNYRRKVSDRNNAKEDRGERKQDRQQAQSDRLLSKAQESQSSPSSSVLDASSSMPSMSELPTPSMSELSEVAA